MNNDEWFSNPLESMPIATDKGHITDEYAPCEVEYDIENPDEIGEPKEPDNIHELMYQIATQNHQIWVGGSENVR